MDPQVYLQHMLYETVLPKNSIMLNFSQYDHSGKYTGGRPCKDHVLKSNPEVARFYMETLPATHGISDNPEIYYENKTFHSIEDTNFYLMPNKLCFINHSFEPIQYKNDRFFWNNQVFSYTKDREGTQSLCCGTFHCDPRIGDRLYLLHSERQSDDIDNIRREITAQPLYPVYWFANGYLCATEWYKYQGLEQWSNYKNRPLKYKYVCMNRLISDNKRYRIQFLNMLDLEHAAYSLPTHCANNGQTPDQIYKNNTVKPHSFDEHKNDSAYIEVRHETPINTAFLHVVTETIFHERKHHLTEKIFKPIVLQQPFVLVAPPGCLRYLKSYGFRTFDSWWDESYDAIENDDKRLQAIADIVNYIASLDYTKLYQLQSQMSEVLEHNRKLFYGSFATDCILELKRNLRQFEL